MTVNELLLELMKLNFEGKGNYKIQAQRGYEYEDINFNVGTIDQFQVATLWEV